MKPRRKTFMAAAAVVTLAAFGGVALAGGDESAEDTAEGTDVAITGDAIDAASQAALDHLGGGQVTDTEVGDEESYYEVEVTRDDGSQVDVQLDEDFNVVGDEQDDETEENDAEDAADRTEANADEDEGAEDAAEDQSEGPDVAITGDPLTKASAKALEVVQQELGQSGRVSATEVGDEESYYEVEVTLDDGSQVDVQLDETFNFVGLD
ncbi:MAG TPA: hypothetical protein VFV13_06595 [Acidimicrobiia bacterium]|nr:hypothetical protein [Acidimicrobiia bacterium]